MTDDSTLSESGTPRPRRSDDFPVLGRRTLDELLERHPEAATTLGDHRFDDRLTDLSPAALDEEQRWASAPAGRADGSRRGRRLTPADRVDAAILRNRLRSRLLRAARAARPRVGPARRQPRHRDLHVARARLRAARRPAPFGGRPAARRARQPRDARAARCATCRACTSRRRSASSPARAPCSPPSSSGRSTQEPSLRAEVEPARDAAIEALDAHIAWLRVQPRRGAAGDPRLGAETFSRKLVAHPRHRERRRRGARPRRGATSRASRSAIAETAARLDPAAPPRVRCAGCSTGSPPRARSTTTTIVGLCEQAMAETTDFVRRARPRHACTTTRSRSS